MVLLSIFYTNQIHGGSHQQIVLYSFCRSMRFALHLAVKIFTLNLSVRRFEHVDIHTSVGCIYQNASRTTLLRNQYY